MKIQLLENEYWYGACVKYGVRMPLHQGSNCTLDFTSNTTPNQAMPLLLSTRGRYLWRDSGFRVSFAEGAMEFPDSVTLESGFDNLKGAYLAAMEKHFPFHGKQPAQNLFRKPIYNTWIEFTFYQNQADILAYAESITANRMPPGVLMIDDGWAEYYGCWKFHGGHFPDSRAMLQRLHAMGFDVMLWVCPYISADTVAYREAVRRDILIKTPEGEPYIARWWNGCSAVLDLSNTAAREWLRTQLKELEALGVDGFKFDAGDSIYYRSDNVTAGGVTPDGQSRLWAEFGEEFSYNEFRASFRAGGYGLLQRLCDKQHVWGSEGIASLIPDTLLQGITGHPFGCPDMIGGGEYLNFQDLAESGLDQELFVRHAETACLMPAMQFSAAPFRVLDQKHYEAILKSLEVRKLLLPHLLRLVGEAAVTGEPVVRYMSYEFPGAPVEMLTDQFMLGTDFLIAPVCAKGCTGREVYLPSGRWKCGSEWIESAGQVIYRDSTAGIPLIFERGPAA